MKELSFIESANTSTKNASANESAEKFSRAKELFAMIRTLVPENIVQKMMGRVDAYQKDALAIDPTKYTFDEEIIGDEGECTVYKLNSLDPTSPSLVMKIDKTLKKPNANKLFERIKLIRDEYETIKKWYQDVPDLIPEEAHFIGNNPRGGKPAIFTIQTFLGNTNEMKDIFRGISMEELLQTLRNDSLLQKNFRTFVDITKRHASENDEIIDTLGKNNLVLIQKEHNTCLVFLDPHHILHPVADTRNAKKLEADLQYLDNVIEALDSRE